MRRGWLAPPRPSSGRCGHLVPKSKMAWHRPSLGPMPPPPDATKFPAQRPANSPREQRRAALWVGLGDRIDQTAGGGRFRKADPEPPAPPRWRERLVLTPSSAADRHPPRQYKRRFDRLGPSFASRFPPPFHLIKPKHPELDFCPRLRHCSRNEMRRPHDARFRNRSARFA